MIEDTTGGGLISDEEIRELLAEPAPPPADQPGAVAGQPGVAAYQPRAAAGHERRVLLVSRRDGDAALLRARLEARGAVVHVVRQPFRALDVLRGLPLDAVVTDLELWADDGALLFDRIRVLGRAIPVLLVGDGPGAEDRALRAGAWGFLARPFDAGAVERAARSLLEAAGEPPGACAGEPALEGAGELPPQETPAAPPRAAEEAAAGPAPPVGAPPAARGAERDAEIPWLRLHLALSRLAREWDPLDARARSVLELVREVLAPSAALLLYEDRGRLAVRIDAPAGAGRPALAALLEAGEGEGSAVPVPAATDPLVIGPGDSGGPRLILAGLDPALGDAARSMAADVALALSAALRE
ncbi:MAG: response regulator [Planctomycetes bacterium]|nr:response regulator [Planctomycetota bacterium]